jgi:hypothetical protein
MQVGQCPVTNGHGVLMRDPALFRKQIMVP